MKASIYQEDMEDIVKILLEPETPAETKLLDKIESRMKNFDPSMIQYIPRWWYWKNTETELLIPKLQLEFPKGWTI